MSPAVTSESAGHFWLASRLAGTIIDHAREEYPREVCGLIAGRDRQGLVLYRARNIASRPEVTYEMDSESLAIQTRLEDEGLELAAIYHSHPASPAYPSPTDVAQAYYPDSVYIICSLVQQDQPDLRAYQIRDGRIAQVELFLMGCDS